MEYYLALIKKETFLTCETQMNSGETTVSEMSMFRKAHIIGSYRDAAFLATKSTETESREVVTRS